MTHIENVTRFSAKSIENVTCQVRALTAWMGGFGQGGRSFGEAKVWGAGRGMVCAVKMRWKVLLFGEKRCSGQGNGPGEVGARRVEPSQAKRAGEQRFGDGQVSGSELGQLAALGQRLVGLPDECAGQVGYGG